MLQCGKQLLLAADYPLVPYKPVERRGNGRFPGEFQKRGTEDPEQRRAREVVLAGTKERDHRSDDGRCAELSARGHVVRYPIVREYLLHEWTILIECRE